MHLVLLILGYIVFSLQGFDLTQISHLLKLDLVNDYIFGLPTKSIDHQVSESDPLESDLDFQVNAYWENWSPAVHPPAGSKSNNATYY